MATMITLNPAGEVATLAEADQFQRDARTGAWLSQFECGYFTAAMLASMAQPPAGLPTLSVGEIIARAEAWYAQYDGGDALSNTNGMSEAQEYDLLRQIGLHFQALPSPSAETALAWLRAGYVLMIAVIEASVHDLALRGANPYPWRPAGTHIFALTGIARDGVNFLVRDPANCTSLYEPSSLRPGPRTYAAQALEFVSMTVVVPPWMPRPSGTTPPPPAHILNPGGTHMLQLADLADVFEETPDGMWRLKSAPSIVIGHAMLTAYRTAGAAPYYGYDLWGKPRGNEQKIAGAKHPEATLQVFERGVLGYHADGAPRGAGDVAPMRIDQGGPVLNAILGVTPLQTTAPAPAHQTRPAPSPGSSAPPKAGA